MNGMIHASDDPIDRSTRRRLLRGVAVAGVTAAVAGCLDDTPAETADDGVGDGPDGEDRPYTVETVAEGLDRAWGLAFLPEDGRLLVTERDGDLRLIDPADAPTDDTADEGAPDDGPPIVSGTPDVLAAGQGGLLDVTTHPEYPDEPFVYLTYVAANADGESATHLGRGRLDPDEPELTDFEALHAAEPFLGSSQHFGSRVVFGADGMAYVTVGDRGSKEFDDHPSQDPSNEIGTILRLEPDGSIPDDNPFLDDADVADSIYAYGLRNTQGLVRHPETDALWASEHGERDGDSITIIERGGNHGWPIAHYGCEYGTDDPVGDQPDERDDVVDPVYYWECGSGGFPPAGMTIYDGDAFPDWAGDLFVGNLAGTYLGHFTIDDPAADRPVVEEVDPLLEAEGWRVRDVAIGPDDGALYVALDETNAPLVRVVPS